MMQTETKKLMLISIASSTFNIYRSTLYRRIESGTLVGYEINNKVYVNADELVDWKVNLSISRRHAIWGQVEALWNEGLPDGDIARTVGRSRERVRQIRTKLGKQPNPRKPKLPKGIYLT